MNQDFTVRVEFYNKATDSKIVRVFDFDSYTANIYHEIKALVGDVEGAFTRLENFKNKEDWDEDTREQFQSIRKKLLNNANNVARLPQTLCYKGVPCSNVSLSEIIADMLNQA